MSTDVERFLGWVDRAGPELRPGLGPCWIWMGSLTRKGYGQFSLGGLNWRAHRAAWHLMVGPIPVETPFVLHRCDMRFCVNPAHLWLGTALDNAADAISKGRHAQQRKTSCPRGHPYDRQRGHHRECRQCSRFWERVRYHRSLSIGTLPLF